MGGECSGGGGGGSERKIPLETIIELEEDNSGHGERKQEMACGIVSSVRAGGGPDFFFKSLEVHTAMDTKRRESTM